MSHAAPPPSRARDAVSSSFEPALLDRRLQAWMIDRVVFWGLGALIGAAAWFELTA